MSEQYFCPICDFKTDTQRKLTTHERITHGEYKCHFCKDIFKQSTTRYQHEKRKHKGVKDYKCNQCDDKFVTSSERDRHEKHIHTGVKDYKCNHCDDKFVTTGDRDRHEKFIHTGVKDYKCNQCDDKFVTSSGRDRHEKHIHTGVKDYKCNHCDDKFVTTGDRDRHEKRKHTGVKDYKCNHCDDKFVTTGDRDRHENRKHNWPLCVICLKFRVDPKRNDVACGFCSRLITYGSKQRIIFEYLFDCYDERLHEPFWTLLDQQMGCGSLRRPDGLMEFETSQGNVKFILEIDEFEHDRNTPACEIARLHELQERDGDALYVLRYNPDAEDALKNYMLDELADRIIDILEIDYKKSFDSPTLIHIEYIGYNEERINSLTRIEIGLQEATLNFFNTLLD